MITGEGAAFSDDMRRNLRAVHVSPPEEHDHKVQGCRLILAAVLLMHMALPERRGKNEQGNRYPHVRPELLKQMLTPGQPISVESLNTPLWWVGKSIVVDVMPARYYANSGADDISSEGYDVAEWKAIETKVGDSQSTPVANFSLSKN